MQQVWMRKKISERGTRLEIGAKCERATMLKGFKSRSLFQLDVKH